MTGTVAARLLRGLGLHGVDHLFGNGGTDFASIIDGYLAGGPDGERLPTPVTVPHENVAMAMAHGCYLRTGRPQAVMVHVTVGTANALNGLINANRAGVPVVLLAGRNPITETGSPASRNVTIHWSQESFDQAAMVREYVKWDYELRDPDMVDAVLDRAFAIAQSEPKGPVYLTLPRELLASPVTAPVSDVRTPPTMISPAAATVTAAAEALRTARAPLIIADDAGAEPAAVEQLTGLAEQLGAPVVEMGLHAMNFPTRHPLHQGYQPAELLAEADCVLVVACDVPWIPGQHGPGPGASVIQLGTDPLHTGLPMWHFPADHAIVARPEEGLAALREAVDAAGGVDAALLTERTQRWATAHDKTRGELAAELESRRSRAPIDFAWATHCLSEASDDSWVFVNEYPLDPRYLELDTPGSFHGYPPAGGLGWGIGAALGIALADPDRLAVACVGDGSYMFGNPTPAHWVARRYDLPILVVIFNNAKWQAVEFAARAVHPELPATGLAFTDLGPAPDYELIVQACGGHGERVDDPAQLPEAIQRAVHVVRNERRTAVLNIIASR